MTLFDSPTTDDVIAITRRSADEKAFAKERRRKRFSVPERGAPVGACCARCVNWRPPVDGDRYGECRVLAVIAPGNRYDCRVAAVDEASKQERNWEYLRTTPWYAGCRAYAEKAA